MRILIIEDNERLAQSLQDVLKQIWYESDICTDGIAGALSMETGAYDAVILDLMLPGRDGFSVLSEARRKGCTTPVLLLTARSEVEDKVRGLGCGADYYLTKPFEPEELLAVVKALVRRGDGMVTDQITFAGITLDPRTYTLMRTRSEGACIAGSSKEDTLTRSARPEGACIEGSSDEGRRLQLGRKEYDLMRILMVNHGQVISKETLLQKVWGSDSDAGDNNVEIYISFLRKKLAYLKAPAAIVTIRGLGYRLEKKEDA